MYHHHLNERLKRKHALFRIWLIIKKASAGFSDDRLLKYSGALSYFMIFSMGPLLLIVISITGFFFGREAVKGRMYGQLEHFVGRDTAMQLQLLIQHAAVSGKTLLSTIIGFVFLLLGASSVFTEMQDSINLIWGLKPKPKSGFVAFLRNRLLSFSMMIGLGFLLLVSLSISALVEVFGNHLKNIFPGASVIVFNLVNNGITLSITFLIFAVIFKVLPDAKIKWNDVTAGAVFTTLLFLLGKFAISFYISKINIGSMYGASGSLVVLMLWIYYSAIILFYGAEFTKFYAMESGRSILPREYAVTVRQVEVDNGNSPVQEKTQLENRKLK
jgi:membrane protein